MLFVACASLVALIGIYVLMPLFRESQDDIDIELLAETEVDRLLTRKAILYGNLKDLNFEYRMGRLSEEDFQRLEATYKNEAAAILRKLDSSTASDNLSEKLEKEIASRKNRLAAAASKNAEDESWCPSCGAEVISGKKFCADCGHALQVKK